MRLFLAFLLCWFPIIASAEDDLQLEVRRFLDVYRVVEQNLADPIDPERAFYQGAIPSMVRTLDPHSAFLDRDQFESLKEMQRSTEKGFGSVLALSPGRVVVLQTLPGSPSARSGLSAGDEFAAVNGHPLAHLSIPQLAALLGQSRQTKVQLMVKRPTLPRLLPMTLVPAEVADPSVSLKLTLKPGIAYIKLANFERETAKDLVEAIDSAGGAALQGLVLDLRGNPGGLVEAALQTAAFFLESGREILWISGREGEDEVVRVPDGFEPYEFPIAVLTDARTASAAELVAGALQDHKRATIVGEPTFGKGLVQSVFELSEGAGLALTTAVYLTPNRRSIQRPLGDCRLFILTPCDEPQQGGAGSETASPPPAADAGGISPDTIVYPRSLSRLEMVIGASGYFLDFAQQYSSKDPDITIDFEVSPQLLDQFQLFLSERQISPGLSDWSASLDFIRSRLKQEILNFALGVAKGDEVEVRRDPQVRAALRAIENR